MLVEYMTNVVVTECSKSFASSLALVERAQYSHPFIICIALSVRIAGKLEPVTSDIREESGYTLGMSPVYHRVNT